MQLIPQDYFTPLAAAAPTSKPQWFGELIWRAAGSLLAAREYAATGLRKSDGVYGQKTRFLALVLGVVTIVLLLAMAKINRNLVYSPGFDAE